MYCIYLYGLDVMINGDVFFFKMVCVGKMFGGLMDIQLEFEEEEEEEFEEELVLISNSSVLGLVF